MTRRFVLGAAALMTLTVASAACAGPEACWAIRSKACSTQWDQCLAHTARGKCDWDKNHCLAEARRICPKPNGALAHPVQRP